MTSPFSLPLVVDAIVKASVILGATALTAAVLRRASASARHLVWTLGLLGALAAPILSLALPRWELPIIRVSAAVPDTAASSITTPTREISQPPARHATGVVPGGPDSASAVPAATRSSLPSLPSWPTLIFLVWAAGAVLILGRVLLGLAAVQWVSHRTPRVDAAPWLDDAHELARGLGLGSVRFRRGGQGTMPMAWGILRSSVLMPADADAWPAHRLRVVLLHELAHVKRHDCLTHLVAQLACAAYWFNPLAWMAARRLRTERERACDDLVLAAGTRGSDYADQLLDIARVMRAGRFPAVMAGASLAMAHRSQLEGRLIAILDPSVPRRGLTRARFAAAATMFGLVIVPIASVQPWAEEKATVNAPVADSTSAQQPQPRTQPAQPAQDPQKPYESYPGQAAADNRRNAENEARTQDMVQRDVQDAVQGAIQGGVQGGIQGGIQGPVQGQIQGTVQGTVQGAVQGALQGVVGGVVGGIAGAAHEFAVPHEAWAQGERESERDKDGQRARDPRTVNALMEALKDSDKDVRETAMHALVQMRDPRMFDPLVAALKDPSADVREQAAFGLGQLRDPRGVDPLSQAIKDSNASVREQVVFALGQLRAVSAVDALSVALHDSSDDVREQAAFALGQIRDKRAADPLISALKDSKDDVREQAAFALGQLREARAVEALVIALKDSSPDVREQVAFALGQIGDARAIDGLTQALKDPNASVRQQAAFALGQIR